MADTRPIVLAADVGATNGRFAFCAAGVSQPEPLWQCTYPTRASDALSELARRACAEAGLRPVAACFGVAGPVQDGVCRATNLPWDVDARELARALALPSVELLNDLEASAHGLLALRDQDFGTLQPGAPGARGNRALISAGTGLGEAGLYWDGERHHPFASEGGHASLAPADELQDELVRWLRQQHEHASCERVLSGPGLVSLYGFLAERKRGSEPIGFSVDLKSKGAAAVTASAMDRTNERAALALDLFCALYGAEAANLALKLMATGGVYLGGGIAPKIEAWLARPPFLKAFLGKGRLKPLLESMPVRIVRAEHVALLGAAQHALRAA